ncbi:zinc finger protein 839 isoform X1 [Elephas maximus indicus]|uniref:zinc finger protein 839 isoform X1 n=2 Tax=Elephas maximus indicus TaxID=99487 RepID=UPI002116B241|nr:zinc finger protein 839 isoform X1 [Elephas maximus indicus]
MGDAEPEAEESSEDGGGGGDRRAPLGPIGRAARVAPLGPEQVRRVLEQVTKAQPLAAPSPPPLLVLQDAARRLRDAAQQAALQRGPGDEPPRPPRLLPPQQLEAICVKVTSGETRGRERPLPPLAAIQPRMARSNLPPGRNHSLLGPGVTSPQLLRVQPLVKTGPQPCHLSSPSQPPVQVFLQRPLPTLSPVSVKRTAAPKAPGGQGATSAPPPASNPLALTSVSPSSANVFISNLHTKHTEKLKKSLKVKTRSGRISRPPKYKAKDYKFIKTEDLADGHPSDSDDYSELSVEEDEDQRGKEAPFDFSSCSLRPKTFKCQTCEKSYIGKGGLARHFKLNPGHGQLEAVVLLSEKANGCIPQVCAEHRAIGPVSLEASAPATLSEEGVLSQHAAEAESTQAGLQSVEVEEALVSEPENESYSALWGPGRHPGPRRGGYSKVPAKSSVAALQQSGAAQPPVDPGAEAEQSAARSRARLKEFPQQCDQEDVVEPALPQLTSLVTVYEFLLMKVGRSHLAKPLFPAVYKEFEELHEMVKKMCQDYLRSCGPCSLEPLEINNSKVAESLGITEEFLRKRATHTDGLPGRRTGGGTDRAELAEAGGQKRESEITEEVLASVKRTRRESVPKDATEPLAAPSRGQERPRTECVPAAREGRGPQVSGHSSCPCGEAHPTAGPVSSCNVLPASQELRVFGDIDAQSGSVGSALLPRAASGLALHTQLAQDTQECSGQRAGVSPGGSGLCSTLVSSGGPGSLLSGRAGSVGVGNLGSECTSRPDGPQPSPSTVTLTDVATPLPKTALSPEALQVDHASTTAPGPGPQPGLDGSQSAATGLESHVGDWSQFSCGAEEPAQETELENIVAVGEAMAFEITSGCHELFSQGQEQIFIQTSDGLILSHPGTVVTREEDIVIVTEAEGSALQMGLPPEAVEAFLAMGAEPCP